MSFKRSTAFSGLLIVQSCSTGVEDENEDRKMDMIWDL